MALLNIKHAYINTRLMFNFMKKSDIQEFSYAVFKNYWFN